MSDTGAIVAAGNSRKAFRMHLRAYALLILLLAAALSVSIIYLQQGNNSAKANTDMRQPQQYMQNGQVTIQSTSSISTSTIRAAASEFLVCQDCSDTTSSIKITTTTSTSKSTTSTSTSKSTTSTSTSISVTTTSTTLSTTSTSTSVSTTIAYIFVDYTSGYTGTNPCPGTVSVKVGTAPITIIANFQTASSQTTTSTSTSKSTTTSSTSSTTTAATTSIYIPDLFVEYSGSTAGIIGINTVYAKTLINEGLSCAPFEMYGSPNSAYVYFGTTNLGCPDTVSPELNKGDVTVATSATNPNFAVVHAGATIPTFPYFALSSSGGNLYSVVTPARNDYVSGYGYTNTTKGYAVNVSSAASGSYETQITLPGGSLYNQAPDLSSVAAGDNYAVVFTEYVANPISCDGPIDDYMTVINTNNNAYTSYTIYSSSGGTCFDSPYYGTTGSPTQVVIPPGVPDVYVVQVNVYSSLYLYAFSLSTGSGTKIGSISCASNGEGMQLYTDSAGTDVYVVCGETLYVVSTASESVVKTISLNSAVSSMAITPTGTYAYVVDGTATVGVWDLSTGAETTSVTLPTGANANYAYMSPDGYNVYIDGEGTAEIYAISTSTNKVTSTYDGISTYGLSSFDNFRIVKLPGNSAILVSTTTVPATTTSSISTSTYAPTTTVPP